MLDASPVEDFVVKLRSQPRLHLNFQIVQRIEILPRVLIINGRSQLKTRSPWKPRLPTRRKHKRQNRGAF